MISTVLIALIGLLERTLQPLCPHGVRLVGLALPPATVSNPEHHVSWGPLSFFEKASESDSGSACSSTSQLGEGSRAQHSAGGLFPASTGSSTSGYKERVIARRATQQTREEAEGWDGTSDGLLASFGKPRSDTPGGTMVSAPHTRRRAALLSGEPASRRIFVQSA